MGEKTNYFNNFIGISPLTKTLRNALIPTEITQKHIIEYGIIKDDELRNENRQILKTIMDDYYRSFLTEKLSSIHDIDWKPLFLEMENELKHGNNKANLEKAQKAKRKAINKCFSEDERYKKMFSAKLSSDRLTEFMIPNAEDYQA